MLLRLVALISIALSVFAVANASDPVDRWPALFGPSSAEIRADKLPLKWSADRNVAWKAELTGVGQSSPVVWDRAVIVTSISGAMKENCHVAAFELDSGKELWQQDFLAPMQVENTNYVSKAAPTPVADGSGVVALFEGGL